MFVRFVIGAVARIEVLQANVKQFLPNQIKSVYGKSTKPRMCFAVEPRQN